MPHYAVQMTVRNTEREDDHDDALIKFEMDGDKAELGAVIAQLFGWDVSGEPDDLVKLLPTISSNVHLQKVVGV